MTLSKKDMKKHKVMVRTYSWTNVRHPRLSSCYVTENRKSLSVRVAYKLNSHSRCFARYVLYAIEKSPYYKNKFLFEISQNVGAIGWKFWYPYKPWLCLRYGLEVVVDSEEVL